MDRLGVKDTGSKTVESSKTFSNSTIVKGSGNGSGKDKIKKPLSDATKSKVNIGESSSRKSLTVDKKTLTSNSLLGKDGERDHVVVTRHRPGLASTIMAKVKVQR